MFDVTYNLWTWLCFACLVLMFFGIYVIMTYRRRMLNVDQAWQDMRDQYNKVAHQFNQLDTLYQQQSAKLAKTSQQLAEMRVSYDNLAGTKTMLDHEIVNLNERITEHENDVFNLNSTIARLKEGGQKKFELSAWVDSEIGPDGAKFSKHFLFLLFKANDGREYRRSMRVLTANNKNKTALTKQADDVNALIEQLVNS